MPTAEAPARAAGTTQPGPSGRSAHTVGVLALGALTSLAALATLPLTLERFLDPHGSRRVALVALTPWGTPTALVVVLAGAGLVALTRHRLRVTSAVVTALGVVALGLHLMWIAPLYIGDAPRPAPGPGLVLLAQNFEYGSVDDLDAAVRDHDVDVLVLTDVVPPQRRAVLTSALARRLAHHIGDEGGSLVLSRYPLRADAFISDGGDSRRAQVESPQLGLVTVVAVHPTPPYLGRQWSGDHDRIRTRVADELRTGSPVIVAGDFNATLDHRPMRRLLDLGLTDSVDQTNGGLSPTWPADGSRRVLGIPVPALVQLDHVLVSGSLVATRSQDLSLAEADHRGVLVSVSRVAAP